MLDKYSIEEINDALNYINAQLDSGYLDIGMHDDLELIIVDRALELFKEKVKEGEI